MFFRTQHLHFFRRTAWAVVFALMLPTAIPLFHHAEAKVMPMPGMHICSADRSSNPSDKQPASGKMPTCPICQTLHILNCGFTGPETVALIVPFGFATPAPAQFVAFNFPHAAVTAAWPTAPPFFA